ncbi:hypothetical protein D049_3717B, partial [Vibrio parahaemolyticus VPTS-2010]
IAANWSLRMPDLAKASTNVELCVAQISIGSCSTQPACG